MASLDWLIIAAYFVFSAGVGVYYTRRAGSSVQEFFLSGRKLPWWLAGTSMVATTFAADTPLAVTELVAKNGIAGNWLWWNFLFGGMLTVFFFARFWRRAGIMTDVEFVELRYSGPSASFLRGFRALYLGIFMNCVIMGWVNLAMAAILEGMFGIPRSLVMWYVAGSLLVTAIYSALSGMWGVAVTDAFQFVLAMTGTIVLAFVVLALPEIGGVSGLRQKLPEWSMHFLPVLGEGSSGTAVGGALVMTVATFLAFVGIQWWASWYPGAEPGGGGYIAQRMMAAKDEKHSLFATLWFTIAHYCIRPWPWILVGLSTLVLYPDLSAEDKKLGYVYAMRDFLPPGLKGMLVASFFAAYMSTISTQLNWGTSYIINDFYKRFINRSDNQQKLVAVSRWMTILMMALSLGFTSAMDTISGAWTFVIEAGAGLGLVLILRWFWWRINAWSEIAAILVPLAVYGFLKTQTSIQFPNTMFIVVAATTVGWLTVTFLTEPTDDETLKSFYRRVHPGGWGWKRIQRLLPDVTGDAGYGLLLTAWIAGIALVYSTLFGIGKLVFGDYALAAIFFLISGSSGYGIFVLLSKVGFKRLVE